MSGMERSTPTRHRPSIERRRASLAAAVVLPVAAALVLVPFRDQLADAAAALLLVAVVVGVASFGDRRAGLTAALMSALAFDFFLTRPYERLSITSAHDVETTVALLVVGVAVTELAVRGRRHLEVAMAEGNYLALLHDLSDLVASGAPPDEVVAVACDDLVEVLALSRCHFEPSSVATGRATLVRSGEVELADRERYDVEHLGLPDGEIELVARASQREFGRFVMLAGGHGAVSIEQRVVALALADQVGTALAAFGHAA